MLLGLGVLFMGVSPRIWMFIICTSLLPHHSSLPNSHNVKALGIYALGSGLGLFMLSLLTTKTFKHLDEQHTAQLYSAVVLVETVGEVVGIPILSSTMIAGISIGGYGVGLPFYVCAVSFTSRTCRSAFAHGLTCASRAFTLPPALRSGSCDPASYGVPRYRTLRFNNIFIVGSVGTMGMAGKAF